MTKIAILQVRKLRLLLLKRFKPQLSNSKFRVFCTILQPLKGSQTLSCPVTLFALSVSTIFLSHFLPALGETTLLHSLTHFCLRVSLLFSRHLAIWAALSPTSTPHAFKCKGIKTWIRFPLKTLISLKAKAGTVEHILGSVGSTNASAFPHS